MLEAIRRRHAKSAKPSKRTSPNSAPESTESIRKSASKSVVKKSISSVAKTRKAASKPSIPIPETIPKATIPVAVPVAVPKSITTAKSASEGVSESVSAAAVDAHGEGEREGGTAQPIGAARVGARPAVPAAADRHPPRACHVGGVRRDELVVRRRRPPLDARGLCRQALFASVRRLQRAEKLCRDVGCVIENIHPCGAPTHTHITDQHHADQEVIEVHSLMRLIAISEVISSLLGNLCKAPGGSAESLSFSELFWCSSPWCDNLKMPCHL